jgi:hypothetical protein
MQNTCDKDTQYIKEQDTKNIKMLESDLEGLIESISKKKIKINLFNLTY